MTRRGVVVAGGGTAGHVLPGLAIARALVELGRPATDIRFIGAARGQEAVLVPAAGFEVQLLPGRGVQRRVSLSSVLAVVGIVRAVMIAVVTMSRRRPEVVVTLGGYASVPAAVAAVIWRIPLVVTEQNARAGAANRMFGRFAAACAVAFDDVDLPRTTRCGIPVRPEILEAAHDDGDGRRRAREALGLPADRTVVAVFSGSLGSATINEAVAGLADQWSDRSDLAVHHVVGRRDAAKYEGSGRGSDAGLIYRVVDYEERMADLLVACDVAVCRAGGSTVAELSVVGVPSVLVPLPIVTRDHQRYNAGALVAAGGAVMILDEECTTERLVTELAPIIADTDRRVSMAAAARGVGRPDAAICVARLVESAAGKAS